MLLAIVGPTAAGKTEVGILLAEALGGEIISADSMQVYRGMDIGTGKPSAEQLARVPHHLIDIVDPDQPFSVADYQARAQAALAQIRGRGRLPILVGGSGLYVRAVVDGLAFPMAPPDPELRRRLMEEARVKGLAALHARLVQVDPEAGQRIHPRDAKRIIRALEVQAQTGRPISELQSLDRERRARYNAGIREFGLLLPRAELYRRIEVRVDEMVARGLVEEVRRLAGRGYGEGLVSMKGLGYAQLLPHLRGACSLEEAVQLLKRDSRRFAKRQLTWFRVDRRIEWVEVTKLGGPKQVAGQIAQRWRETWASAG
jgi:tRNA dimethylallyltransferase